MVEAEPDTEMRQSPRSLGLQDSSADDYYDDLELSNNRYDRDGEVVPSPPRQRRCSTPVVGLHQPNDDDDDAEGTTPPPPQDTFAWTAAAPPSSAAAAAGSHHAKPSPPLPMNFVEFVTIPSPPEQNPRVDTSTSTWCSPSERYQRNRPDVSSHQQRPFRLMPRSKTTLDKVVNANGSRALATSPARLRKRSAWSISDGTEVATLATDESATASPGTAALKHTLYRLSIHSPTCSSEGTTTYYEGLQPPRSSTPSSSFAKRSSTPLTIEGSPSSCFSKVISTPRQHRGYLPYHCSPRAQESPSPKIVPLTVLTHDDGSPSTEGVKLPPRQQRLVHSRSPPEVRSLWSADNSLHPTPDSDGSGIRLPKISLTPRRSPRKSVPKFPIGDAVATPANDSMTIESFLKSTPRAVGESIFGPPTPTELQHSLQQRCPQETVGRPDLESLSDGGDDDEFMLAFPTTLAEEKLQRRSIKLRKTDEVGDQTRSMASSSCTSLRGIAFAPSDPSLYEMATLHGSMDLNSEPQDAGQHHIGWVFDDADDHVVPARDMVTPPIMPTTSHPSLPPLLRSNHHRNGLSHLNSKPGQTPCSF